jgi:type 1 glutamine amidotransferase
MQWTEPAGKLLVVWESARRRSFAKQSTDRKNRNALFLSVPFRKDHFARPNATSYSTPMTTPSRRSILKTSAALAFSPLLARLASAAAADNEPRKKVLFFTKSAGFEHSVITRPAAEPTKLAYAEQILTDLGAEHGFDVTCSKDGTIFSADNLKNFDVFAFYTTGDLTTDSDKYSMKSVPGGKPEKDKFLWKEPAMPQGAKEAFLDAIAGGKGFIGFHCAADTFHSPGYSKAGRNLLRDINETGADVFDPYIKMLGGEFVIHGKQQKATLKATDRTFPGATALDNANFMEEWYSLKNFAPDLHVILAQDCQGMEGPMYQRAMFPETWARMHNKGRVFYTSLGHREDIWQRPDFRALVIAALNWTGNRIDADITPNLRRATPDAEVNKPGS